MAGFKNNPLKNEPEIQSSVYSLQTKKNNSEFL